MSAANIRELRLLAPSGSSRGSDSSSLGSPINEPRDLHTAKPKRAVVHVACLACRRSRSKCDGQRPICTPCSKREETCEYDVEANTSRISSLKRKNDIIELELEQYRELYSAIRKQPEHDAVEIFRRIRATEEPLEILRHLKAANMLVDEVRGGDSSTSEEMTFQSTIDL